MSKLSDNVLRGGYQPVMQAVRDTESLPPCTGAVNGNSYGPNSVSPYQPDTNVSPYMNLSLMKNSQRSSWICCRCHSVVAPHADTCPKCVNTKSSHHLPEHIMRAIESDLKHAHDQPDSVRGVFIVHYIDMLVKAMKAIP